MTIDEGKRNWTTNHAELQASSPDPQLRPQMIQGPPADVADGLEQTLHRQSRWSQVSRDEQGGVIHLHLTHRTRWLRFTDDVHVTLAAVDGVTEVTASSRCRIGKWDFGQNRRNLKELVQMLQSVGTASR